MHAGDGRMLRAKLGTRIPAGVKEHKHGPNVVARCDGEECVDALTECLRILFPNEVMQEDAHSVHADGLGPAQLAVNRCGVEGISLPHFKLIDGGGWKEVGSYRPGLLR